MQRCWWSTTLRVHRTDRQSTPRWCRQRFATGRLYILRCIHWPFSRVSICRLKASFSILISLFRVNWIVSLIETNRKHSWLQVNTQCMVVCYSTKAPTTCIRVSMLTLKSDIITEGYTIKLWLMSTQSWNMRREFGSRILFKDIHKLQKWKNTSPLFHKLLGLESLESRKIKMISRCDWN